MGIDSNGSRSGGWGYGRFDRDAVALGGEALFLDGGNHVMSSHRNHSLCKNEAITVTVVLSVGGVSVSGDGGRADVTASPSNIHEITRGFIGITYS